MKYIKTYELEDYIFRKGDIVVCIDDKGNGENLIKGKKYKVISSYTDRFGKFVKIENHEDEDYFKHRFIPEIEYDIYLYNL